MEGQLMIDPETADEGTALISTAIGELMEDAAADARRVPRGDFPVMAVRADRLKAVGSDVVAQAEALAVLARHAGPQSG
jgi:hypothetical protein